MIKLSTTTIQQLHSPTFISFHHTTPDDPPPILQFRKYTTNLDTRYHTSSLIYHHFLTFRPFMAICTTVSGSSIAIVEIFFWGELPATYEIFIVVVF